MMSEPGVQTVHGRVAQGISEIGPRVIARCRHVLGVGRSWELNRFLERDRSWSLNVSRDRTRRLRAPALAGMAQTLTLLAILSAAIGLRLWIAGQAGAGHMGDLALFERWIRGLHEHGLGGFYAAEGFCDYPPVMLLLLRGLGGVVFGLFGEPGSSVLHTGVKYLAGLGDIAIGLMLPHEGRRLLGVRAGVLACGLYLLNPVAVYNSAYWGQLDSIYTALLIGSFVLLRRGHWAGAGLVGSLSLAAKFQAVAVLPLLLFEAYRLARARGLARVFAGAVVGLSAVAVPFVVTGTLQEVIDRAYVGVVGQYHDMSNNAYNLWFLLGNSEMPDSSPAEMIIRAAAGGRSQVNTGESWLMGLSWRKVSLALFALAVAVVLSLYARRPGHIARYGAAGLLALCFYLFPTEMHERYAYPAVAFLALWAAAHPRNERLYWVLSIGLTLNLVAVLSIAPLAPQIAAVNLVVFALILAGLGLARSPHEPAQLLPAAPPEKLPRLIRGFQGATVAALVLGACFAGAVWWRASTARDTTGTLDSGHIAWLSDLTPLVAEQGWKVPARNRSVEGGPLRIGDQVYLRGVGTHAPAILVYDIPPHSEAFDAVIGINHAAGTKGSAVVRIELDGVECYDSGLVSPHSGAVPVSMDIKGRETLTIRIDPTGDGRRFDHVDLALARFSGIQSR